MRGGQFQTIHLNGREEAFNHIHLQLDHLLLREAARVALSAVVNPGLDVFTDVQISLLKVVVQWKPGGTIPEWKS